MRARPRRRPRAWYVRRNLRRRPGARRASRDLDGLPLERHHDGCATGRPEYGVLLALARSLALRPSASVRDLGAVAFPGPLEAKRNMTPKIPWANPKFSEKASRYVLDAVASTWVSHGP